MCRENAENDSHIPSAVGQAACGIVHDLSNLIQTIILRAEVTAATEPVSAACIKRMEQIVDDGQGGANLVRSLLEYARKSIDSLTPADLRKTVEDTASWLNISHKAAIALTCDEDAMTARFDLGQLRDLIEMCFEELQREAAPGVAYALSIKHAKPEGEALSWMSEELWLELKFTRMGLGAQVELDEGNLFRVGMGAPVGDQAMNLMRIRGIVRQHRGQIRVIEEIDDNAKKLSIEAFFPMVSAG